MRTLPLGGGNIKTKTPFKIGCLPDAPHSGLGRQWIAARVTSARCQLLTKFLKQRFSPSGKRNANCWKRRDTICASVSRLRLRLTVPLEAARYLNGFRGVMILCIQEKHHVLRRWTQDIEKVADGCHDPAIVFSEVRAPRPLVRGSRPGCLH